MKNINATKRHKTSIEIINKYNIFYYEINGLQNNKKKQNKNKNNKNTDVIINGSILSTDSYAMKHRLNTRPHQILRIYNNDDVCTYRLNLN